jgi:hypothetical protein
MDLEKVHCMIFVSDEERKLSLSEFRHAASAHLWERDDRIRAGPAVPIFQRRPI